MKKWIAMLLTLTLALSLSVTAFVAEITEKDENPTEAAVEITTSIAPAYTVAIPKDVQVRFNQTSTEFGAVKLTAAQIDSGYAVKVTLTAGDRTALTIDITQADWDAAYAGNYSDTVTFTISYGKATP